MVPATPSVEPSAAAVIAARAPPTTWLTESSSLLFFGSDSEVALGSCSVWLLSEWGRVVRWLITSWLVVGDTAAPRCAARLALPNVRESAVHLPIGEE